MRRWLPARARQRLGVAVRAPAPCQVPLLRLGEHRKAAHLFQVAEEIVVPGQRGVTHDWLRLLLRVELSRHRGRPRVTNLLALFRD